MVEAIPEQLELKRELFRRLDGICSADAIFATNTSSLSVTEISAATRFGYEQVVREFLAYLGPRGVKRRLDAITEADIRGFMVHLDAEGRSSATDPLGQPSTHVNASHAVAVSM